MSKDKRSVEVVSNHNHQYYSSIVISDELTDSFFSMKTSRSFLYTRLLHACLWRSSGASVLDSAGFLAICMSKYPKDYNTKIGSTCQSAFNDLKTKVELFRKDISDKDKGEFEKKNKLILDQFKNEVLGIDFSSFSDGIFNGVLDLPNLQKPVGNNKVYKKACEIVNTAIGDVILGVGSSPIYIPIFSGTKKNPTILLQAIFVDHPLYNTFQSAIKKIVDDIDPKLKGKKAKEVDDLVVKVIEKAKRGDK